MEITLTQEQRDRIIAVADRQLSFVYPEDEPLGVDYLKLGDHHYGLCLFLIPGCYREVAYSKIEGFDFRTNQFTVGLYNEVSLTTLKDVPLFFDTTQLTDSKQWEDLTQSPETIRAHWDDLCRFIQPIAFISLTDLLTAYLRPHGLEFGYQFINRNVFYGEDISLSDFLRELQRQIEKVTNLVSPQMIFDYRMFLSHFMAQYRDLEERSRIYDDSLLDIFPMVEGDYFDEKSDTRKDTSPFAVTFPHLDLTIYSREPVIDDNPTALDCRLFLEKLKCIFNQIRVMDTVQVSGTEIN